MKALTKAAAQRNGPEFLRIRRKAPLTLQMLLDMRTATSGQTISSENADVTINWDEPLWICVWAIFMLMWYAGCRKSDILVCSATPFDRMRLNANSILFFQTGTTIQRPTQEPTNTDLSFNEGDAAYVWFNATKADPPTQMLRPTTTTRSSSQAPLPWATLTARPHLHDSRNYPDRQHLHALTNRCSKLLARQSLEN
jgi:hypothetical protein